MNDFNFDPSVFNKQELDKIFNTLWKGFIEKLLISQDYLNKKKSAFLAKTFQMQNKFNEFYNVVEETPIVVVLQQWLIAQAREKQFLLVKDLIDEKILMIKDKNERLLTVKDLKEKTHEKILEEIRCIDEWNFYEKEQYVQIYLDFSFYLAKSTFNYIPIAKDPDREKVSSRLIKYEIFIEFITNLSKRDALIAKVLYFGAPTIEEVIALKFSQINRAEGKIHFSSKTVNYPKHLLDRLFFFTKKTKTNSLVFVNIKDKEVERSHLNQSFSRASEKMIKATKITPGMLLRHMEAFAKPKNMLVK